MKLLNEMEKQEGLSANSRKLFVKLLAPFAPHIAEEIWFTLFKQKKSVHLESWPKYDESFLKEELFDLVIQINGKVRGVLKVTRGTKEEEAKSFAVSFEKVIPYLAGKVIKKVIFVPDRLINLVIQ